MCLRPAGSAKYRYGWYGRVRYHTHTGMVVVWYHTIPTYHHTKVVWYHSYHTVSLSAYDIDTSLQKTIALSPRAPNSLHTFCAFARQLVRAYHGS